jgi:hypothetical protein
MFKTPTLLVTPLANIRLKILCNGGPKQIFSSKDSRKGKLWQKKHGGFMYLHSGFMYLFSGQYTGAPKLQ